MSHTTQDFQQIAAQNEKAVKTYLTLYFQEQLGKDESDGDRMFNFKMSHTHLSNDFFAWVVENVYELRSQTLLEVMGVKFSTKYVTYGKHFINDTHNRHIFDCKFTRKGEKPLKIRFGQSINAGNTSPKAYDVLSCIQKYDVGSIEYFCSEFGYDIYESTTKRIYKAVCKEYEGASRFFNQAEIELLQNIW